MPAANHSCRGRGRAKAGLRTRRQFILGLNETATKCVFRPHMVFIVIFVTCRPAGFTAGEMRLQRTNASPSPVLHSPHKVLFIEQPLVRADSGAAGVETPFCATAAPQRALVVAANGTTSWLLRRADGVCVPETSGSPGDMICLFFLWL